MRIGGNHLVAGGGADSLWGSTPVSQRNEKAFSYCVSLDQQAPTQPADKSQEYNLHGKAIGRNSNHIMPKRNYTGEKCKEQKESGKAFSYPLSLRIHVQPHAAEKRYDF